MFTILNFDSSFPNKDCLPDAGNAIFTILPIMFCSLFKNALEVLEMSKIYIVHQQKFPLVCSPGHRKFSIERPAEIALHPVQEIFG